MSQINNNPANAPYIPSTSISLNQNNPFYLNQQDPIFHILKIKNKKKWTSEEDNQLIAWADKYKEKHWKEISQNFTNKNPLQCFSRYKRIRPGIIKGSWSHEEDDEIINWVQQYGKSWSKIAKLWTTRNGKQIRDRFTNVLDKEIKKGKFSDDEDKLLIKLYIAYGPKWAMISKSFPNRTADMIKNRFHSSIKKIFFSQETINKQTKTMLSWKEKKINAWQESEMNNQNMNNPVNIKVNIIDSGEGFSLQSTRPNSYLSKKMNDYSTKIKENMDFNYLSANKYVTNENERDLNINTNHNISFCLRHGEDFKSPDIGNKRHLLSNLSTPNLPLMLDNNNNINNNNFNWNNNYNAQYEEIDFFSPIEMNWFSMDNYFTL